jgi:hypothetical protein
VFPIGRLVSRGLEPGAHADTRGGSLTRDPVLSPRDCPRPRRRAPSQDDALLRVGQLAGNSPWRSLRLTAECRRSSSRAESGASCCRFAIGRERYRGSYLVPSAATPRTVARPALHGVGQLVGNGGWATGRQRGRGFDRRRSRSLRRRTKSAAPSSPALPPARPPPRRTRPLGDARRQGLRRAHGHDLGRSSGFRRFIR